MFVNDNNTQHPNGGSVGCVVDKETEAMPKHEDVSASYVVTYDLKPISLHFTATEVARYASSAHELMRYDSYSTAHDDEESSPDELLQTWYNILQATGGLGKPQSGSLYSIDASIIERSDTGRDRAIYRRQGVTMAYWLQYQGVLVYKIGDIHTRGLSNASLDESQAIKLIRPRLYTFGHDLASALGAGSGCYIKDWPAYDPSAPIPDEALPKVTQAQEVAIK